MKYLFEFFLLYALTHMLTLIIWNGFGAILMGIDSRDTWIPFYPEKPDETLINRLDKTVENFLLGGIDA